MELSPEQRPERSPLWCDAPKKKARRRPLAGDDHMLHVVKRRLVFESDSLSEVLVSDDEGVSGLVIAAQEGGGGGGDHDGEVLVLGGEDDSGGSGGGVEMMSTDPDDAVTVAVPVVAVTGDGGSIGCDDDLEGGDSGVAVGGEGIRVSGGRQSPSWGRSHCVHSCSCTPGSRHLLCCELVSVGNDVSVARCPLCNLTRSEIRVDPFPYLSPSSYSSASSSASSQERQIDKDGVVRRATNLANTDEERCVASGPGRVAQRSPIARRRERQRDRHRRSSPRRTGARSWSDEQVIVSPFPGLKCYVTTFDNIREPELLETGSACYLPVYVPYSANFCDAYCRRRCEAGAALVGKGSFGQVWKLPGETRVALKAAGDSHDETVLTVWISGVVRSRARDAGFAGDLGESVYCNILTATGSCLKHNLVAFAALERDLYNYRGWHVKGLASYRRAFAGLGDGLRFLNLHCGIAHFDVTPMNILVRFDRANEWLLERAVICDFSLSQFHGEKNEDGRCVVVFEETKTVRALQRSTYYLTDLYHPAFKPLPLQKLCSLSPRMQFPNPTAQRLCVADLCALGNVVAFCLVRVFDERGQPKVRITSEDALFGIARKTCDALSRHDIHEVANYCSLLITRQLAYAATIVGASGVEDAVRSLCAFFVKASDEEAPERFKSVYKKARREIDGSYMVRLLEAAADTEDGRYLIENVRATCLTVDLEGFDVDPHTLFP